MIKFFKNVELSIDGKHLVDIPEWGINAGKVYGLSGETGSGKSTIGKWLGGIEPVYWEVRYTTDDPLQDAVGPKPTPDYLPMADNPSLYLLQDAYQIFNPYVTIIRHFRDIWQNRQDLSALSSFDEVLDIIRSMGIADPVGLMKRKVGRISQGEAQRLAFGLGLIRPASLRIYDEVFSNVDRPSSQKMLDVLHHFCNRTGTSAVIISHDMAMLRSATDSIYIISDGVLHVDDDEVVFTQDKISVPTQSNLIHFEELGIPGFGKSGTRNKVLWKRAEFSIGVAECVGLSGSSGRGKTTFLRGLMGEHELSWTRCTISHPRDLKLTRLDDLDIRYLPQSVSSAFNPAHNLRTSIAEITDVQGISKQEVLDLLTAFGLSETHLDSFPSMLSGGEIQRLGVISVLLGQPDLVLLDESFSSVDEETRDSIWSVVTQLQTEKGFAMLVVSHDTSWLETKMNRVYEVGL